MKKMRKEKEIKAWVICSELGISEKTLQRIENCSGKVSKEILEKVSNYLGIIREDSEFKFSYKVTNAFQIIECMSIYCVNNQLPKIELEECSLESIDSVISFLELIDRFSKESYSSLSALKRIIYQKEMKIILEKLIK
ncbi:MAG: hypothetical protein ACRCZ2_08025 [Fusobacteriaceae bacterium]